MNIKLIAITAFVTVLTACGSTSDPNVTTRNFKNTNAAYSPDPEASIAMQVIKTAGMGDNMRDAKVPEGAEKNGIFGATGEAILNLNSDLVTWTRGGGSLISGLTFSALTGLFSDFPDLKYMQYIDFVPQSELPLDTTEEELLVYYQKHMMELLKRADPDSNPVVWDRSNEAIAFTGKYCTKHLIDIKEVFELDEVPDQDCLIAFEPEIVRPARPNAGNPSVIDSKDVDTTVVRARIINLSIDTKVFVEALDNDAFFYMPKLSKKQRKLKNVPNYPHVYRNDGVYLFIKPQS